MILAAIGILTRKGPGKERVSWQEIKNTRRRCLTAWAGRKGGTKKMGQILPASYSWSLLLLAVPLLLATMSDIRKRTIPVWCVAVMLAGGLVVAVHDGNAKASLLGLASGFAVMFAIAWMGGVGGGDVKLSAALGAWFGPGVLVVLILTGIGSFLWGAVSKIKEKRLLPWAYWYLGGIALSRQGVKGALALPTLEDTTDEAVPLSVFIAVSSALYLALLYWKG